MILRSLSAPAAVEIQRLRREHESGGLAPQISFREAGLDYFGIYIKLFRGYFYEWGPDCKLNRDAAVHLFEHTFNMILLRSLLVALLDARDKRLLSIDSTSESTIVDRINKRFNLSCQSTGFHSLIDAVDQQANAVGDYVGAIRIGPEATYKGAHTYIHDFLDGCCQIILEQVSDLKGCRVYFLLDEYENLAEFQQTVVNTLTKLRPLSLSVKISTRALGIKSLTDLQGEAIQRPRDYEVVVLDYDVRSSNYRNLLRDIAEKRLRNAGYDETNISILLPEAPAYAPSCAADVEAALRENLQRNGVDASTLPPDKWRECLHQWDNALVFRLSSRMRQPKSS